MTLPILYKRTSTGKIQQWSVEVQDNKFRVTSGQTDGKKVTSKWTECFGKNLGKANETSDDEQAQAQAEAKHTKQLAKHYFLDINQIDETQFVKAMLAKKYEDEFNQEYEDLYSQPKLDGMRCFVTKDGMFSRGGKPILSAPHIFEAMKSVFEQDPDFVFDGELYASHLRADFEKLISLAKRTKPSSSDIKESAKHLEYWVYDIAGGISTDKLADADTFYSRSILLKWIVKAQNAEAIYNSRREVIVFTPTEQVRDQEHMDELYQGYLAAGQEGQMLRKGESLYEGKRSKNLLKRKEFMDEEFTITSLNEGIGNYSGMIKSVSFKTKEGITFDTGIKGNQEYLTELFVDPAKYVGSEATVRFQNYTAEGKPRFGVTYHIWDGNRDV